MKVEKEIDKSTIVRDFNTLFSLIYEQEENISTHIFETHYHATSANWNNKTPKIKSGTGFSWWLSGKELTCQCGRGFPDSSMGKTQVQPLLREDPTCRGATEPECQEKPLPMRNMWTATREEPPLATAKEKPAQQQRPSRAPPKINKFFENWLLKK